MGRCLATALLVAAAILGAPVFSAESDATHGVVDTLCDGLVERERPPWIVDLERHLQDPFTCDWEDESLAHAVLAVVRETKVPIVADPQITGGKPITISAETDEHELTALLAPRALPTVTLRLERFQAIHVVELIGRLTGEAFVFRDRGLHWIAMDEPPMEQEVVWSIRLDRLFSDAPRADSAAVVQALADLLVETWPSKDLPPLRRRDDAIAVGMPASASCPYDLELLGALRERGLRSLPGEDERRLRDALGTPLHGAIAMSCSECVAELGKRTGTTIAIDPEILACAPDDVALSVEGIDLLHALRRIGALVSGHPVIVHQPREQGPPGPLEIRLAYAHPHDGCDAATRAFDLRALGLEDRSTEIEQRFAAPASTGDWHMPERWVRTWNGLLIARGDYLSLEAIEASLESLHAEPADERGRHALPTPWADLGGG